MTVYLQKVVWWGVWAKVIDLPACFLGCKHYLRKRVLYLVIHLFRGISVKLVAKYHFISTGTWFLKSCFLLFLNNVLLFFFLTWCNRNWITRHATNQQQERSTFHRLMTEWANSCEFCRIPAAKPAHHTAISSISA